MSRQMDPKRFRDMLTLLSEFERLFDRLSGLIQQRVDAMRRADIEAMSAWRDEELALTKQIEDREGCRRQLMDAVAESLGLPCEAARVVPVSNIIGRLDQAQADRLNEAAQGLRQSVTRATRLNRQAGDVSGAILDHLSWVSASVRPQGEEAVGYKGDGGVATTCETVVFDAMG
jgi:hypothetical protein